METVETDGVVGTVGTVDFLPIPLPKTKAAPARTATATSSQGERPPRFPVDFSGGRDSDWGFGGTGFGSGWGFGGVGSGGVGRGDDVSGGSVPRATRQYAPPMSSATSRRSP